ncbi:MAG: hypothetical protein ABSG63_14820 [Spirochaetia bacterium]|jgi:hypothetical protein
MRENVELSQKGTIQASRNDEIGGVAWSRFNPDVRITEGMMWHPPRKLTLRRHHNQNAQAGPTWGHLFGQIVVGFIEILIPLAFIAGMIYWRAPWLFLAVVHFFRGEPIIHF